MLRWNENNRASTADIEEAVSILSVDILRQTKEHARATHAREKRGLGKAEEKSPTPLLAAFSFSFYKTDKNEVTNYYIVNVDD